jgi:hypothetical protein
MGNKGTLFDPNVGDRPFNMALINNYSATTNPGSSNDISQGYRKGSEWLNTSTQELFKCVVDTAGAAVWEVITSGSSTPGQVTAPAASTPTGAGSNAGLTGGAGGSTSGAGGNSQVTGGAGTAGNANGGDVILAGGAANGSGANGVVREQGIVLSQQGAPAAATTSATLTAANILAGIITVLQGGGANSAQQLPLATAMDTALPTSVASDAFDFSVINLSVAAGETASITTNTGWTLVGSMSIDIQTAVSGATPSAGRFRARKTGAGAWTLYRLS